MCNEEAKSMDCLQILIRDVTKHCPKLSREEQVAKSRLWISHNDLEAREQLILSILPWAVKLAKSYHYATKMPLSDLASVAFEGAIAAVDRFDPERGFALSTFSGFWIRQKLMRYVEENWTVIHVPAHASQQLRDMKKSCLNVRDDNSCVDGAKRVSLGVASLDEEYCCFSRGDVFDNSLLSSLFDKEASPEMKAMDSEEVEILQEHLDRLPERERYVFKKRLAGVTLRKIGLVLGVTRERVRQIESVARKKLLDSFRERVGQDE